MKANLVSLFVRSKNIDLTLWSCQEAKSAARIFRVSCRLYDTYRRSGWSGLNPNPDLGELCYNLLYLAVALSSRG